MSELMLVMSVKKEDAVLCFGNLPPLLRLRGLTFVYLQNRYLVENINTGDFAITSRLRLLVERMWLKFKYKNADEFFVQTPSMKKLLDIKIKGMRPVKISPFSLSSADFNRSVQKTVRHNFESFYEFLYLASGEPHKNHIALIDAWCLMAKEGLFPSLCLTVDSDRFPAVVQYLDLMKDKFAIKVDNLGCQTHEQALTLYKKCGALIFVSKYESLGLPLIEAAQVGLPILAPELDYIRDLIDPTQTFDPNSPLSITRSVKRYIGASEASLPIMDTQQFLDSVFGDNA
jgi:glycosyltransferase involved in cell wall biosynthesis